MFAHQVIEDLVKENPEDQKLRDMRNRWVSGIKRAIKFHIDDVLQAIGVCDQLLKNEKIFGNTQYTKFPYGTTWFDYETRIPGAEIVKQGILASHIGDEVYHIQQFSFWKSMNQWISAPLACRLIMNSHGMNHGELQYSKLVDMSEGDTAIVMEDTQMTMSALHCILTVLNCKNIITEKISAPQALNKKRRKNNKQEIFDYHVLNVFVPSNNKRGYHEQSTPLSHNRVHLCRGHFKEYTAEHPLFGRLTGLYWWQPHVRGQNKDGIVMKDYEVKYERP